VAKANDTNKFRHISLVESVYKILAKVLASRFRGGFLHGHRILDAFLIANECIDYYLKTNLLYGHA